MEEIVNLNKNYLMLIYLADRGQILNQLDVCSALWDELLEAPYEKAWFRDLRICFRRLRSALALLEPLLPEEGKLWLNSLKSRSYQLGSVREYDVALQACDKYEAYVRDLQVNDNVFEYKMLENLTQLKLFLQNERKLKEEGWLANSQAACIAQEMQACNDLLKQEAELNIEDEAEANAFLQARLQMWGLKLCNKLQNIEKLKGTAQLHKLRIKIKRFRYAYEVYMQGALDEELLYSLKELQDVLGSLHDSERNIEIVEDIVKNNMDNISLVQEFVHFKQWRSIKTDQRNAQLDGAVTRLLALLQVNIVGARLL